MSDDDFEWVEKYRPDKYEEQQKQWRKSMREAKKRKIKMGFVKATCLGKSKININIETLLMKKAENVQDITRALHDLIVARIEDLLQNIKSDEGFHQIVQQGKLKEDPNSMKTHVFADEFSHIILINLHIDNY
ncbi:MAG: hypothetical protein ACFE9L_13180 [Candidatus Hodarchaeota archaeon]